MNSHYPRYNFRGKVNSFSYFIADPAARAATATVTITVNNINDPPTITSDGGGDTASLNVVENQTGVIDVESSDPDGDTEGAGLTYSLAGADQGLFSIASDTGVLTFNAPPDFEIPGDDDTDNVYEIQVTVTDSGGLTDVQELSVTVADVDDPPQAVDGAVTVDEDSVNTLILVLSNDTDVDGGPISISSLPQPPDGTVLLVNAGTTVSYTPDAGYCNDGIPTDDFTYTLTPGGSSATVQVTVTCLPDPPLAGVTTIPPLATPCWKSAWHCLDVQSHSKVLPPKPSLFGGSTCDTFLDTGQLSPVLETIVPRTMRRNYIRNASINSGLSFLTLPTSSETGKASIKLGSNGRSISFK